MKHYFSEEGFTLIELIVSVAIVAILSLIVLFSVVQYVNSGKDSNVQGNLAVLVPAGEAYYNGNEATNGTGYNGFCASSAVTNIVLQLSVPSPINDCPTPNATPGLCCAVNGSNNQWAACAQDFTDVSPLMAYCVDSTGVRRKILNSECTNTMTQCPSS
jgi:prepilin-type N-terminal cleavage/methylation domain-containing protein